MKDARRFDGVDAEFKVCRRQFSILARFSKQYGNLVKRHDLGYCIYDNVFLHFRKWGSGNLFCEGSDSKYF